MNFGQKLKDIRTSQNISLKALSAQIEIDRAYLSKVESNKVPPSEGLLKKLSNVLNYDYEDLLILSGRLPNTWLEEIYKNPDGIAKKLRLVINTPLQSILPFPERTTIEDGFPFEYISDIAEVESYRKEVYRPIYHIHKWWAQRLGSVFRSILMGAALPEGTDLKKSFYQSINLSEITVFDPFMGSGTTIGEALKLGCKVIGRDINPVSYFIVKNALGRYSSKEVLETFKAIENDVSSILRSFYKTKTGKGLNDVLYYFWVKTIPCPKCTETVDLFSSYIFSSHAYPKEHPEAKALCPFCGHINACLYNTDNLTCNECKKTFNPSKGNAARTNATCPYCFHEFPIAKTIKESNQLPTHRMYAKLILDETGEKKYCRIDHYDEALYKKAAEELKKKKDPYPLVAIEQGFNTNQVLNYNYNYWHQMFNERQLLCLSILAERIRNIDNAAMRSLFTCLFSGCLEFNNMFASFKGEGTGAVRHMFSHHILKPERTPLEANLWGTRKSSGSFLTLFESRLLRAIVYREKPFELKVERAAANKLKGSKIYNLSQPLGTEIATNYADLVANNKNLYLSSGDSAKTDMPPNSIDLVITDPPFFDNVHYSELADFFYVWIKHILGNSEVFNDTSTRKDGEVQNADVNIFSQNLSNVFSECNRVLKKKGLLVFTYHHSKHQGWIAVLEAIVESGFFIAATHPVKSEMSGAAPKQQAKEPIDLDVIIVCRKRDISSGNSIDTNLKDRASELAKKQISRFNKVGRFLSYNDIRIVLMSQVIARLSKADDIQKMEKFLKDSEEDIEKNIKLLHSQQQKLNQLS